MIKFLAFKIYLLLILTGPNAGILVTDDAHVLCDHAERHLGLKHGDPASLAIVVVEPGTRFGVLDSGRCVREPNGEWEIESLYWETKGR